MSPPQPGRSSPYRQPEAPPPRALYPDSAIFAPRWWTHLLVISAFGVPIALALTWLTDMRVRTGALSHGETFAEKIGTTFVLALWLSVLLAFRARDRRRQRAVLRELTATEKEEPVHVRVDQDLRVASPDSPPSEEARDDDEAPMLRRPPRTR